MVTLTHARWSGPVTQDELFLSTLEDLERRLTGIRPSEVAGRRQQYELVMVASLLRKLLLDGGSLVALTNRTPRLRLSFVVSGWPFMSGSGLPGSRVSTRYRTLSATIPTIPQDQLPPEFSEIIRERHVTLDRMLAEALVIWNGTPITAKGLITYVANKGGGVHFGGRPTGRAEEALYEFGQDVIVDGYPLALAGLRDVGEVAISGLEPLRMVIEAEIDSGGLHS